MSSELAGQRPSTLAESYRLLLEDAYGQFGEFVQRREPVGVEAAENLPDRARQAVELYTPLFDRMRAAGDADR
ncbi:hypothetical protein [Nonomuraea sp. LPB2021202275-12-8]|uniref:hypothetical protein n=1 Tax=Nonomuraea sp. LPB2021202275-12-8 TaxID=3120159 RepID=UPI00300D1551